MNGRRRVLLLILTMSVIVLGVGGIALSALYNVAFDGQRARLVEIAQSRARLIEAVARFDARNSADDVPGGAVAATLSQVRDAHKSFQGFGKTGEFELAKREGDQIVFLLQHREDLVEYEHRVPLSSKLVETMRRALSGASGTLVGPDCDNVTVLAAYEPVSELNMGIVAKIDLAEIRAPFLRAAGLAALGALGLVLFGALLFHRVADPLVQRTEENEKKYRALFESSTEGVFLTKDSVFVECNAQGARIFACTPEELIGYSLVDVSFPPSFDRSRGKFK
jgi:PAS domain-containing protein